VRLQSRARIQSFSLGQRGEFHPGKLALCRAIVSLPLCPELCPATRKVYVREKERPRSYQGFKGSCCKSRLRVAIFRKLSASSSGVCPGDGALPTGSWPFLRRPLAALTRLIVPSPSRLAPFYAQFRIDPRW
jgi:hypothetical protein